MRTPIKSLLVTVFLVCLLSLAGAEEKRVTLGGDAGWPTLAESAGLTRGSGRLGKEAIVLSTSLPPGASAAVTDLYLSFDETNARDETGTYTQISSALLHAGASKARRGAGTALCNTNGAGLVLRGGQGSLFATPGTAGSFSIEFWLYPAVTENGSVLFQWRSSRIGMAESVYQYIRSTIFRNHLEWTFSNIWTESDGTPLDVTIAGRKNLIPGVWSHHVLSYDSLSGVLEYCLDGSTEAIRYLTSTGTESGDVYPAIFGSPADIDIAPRFSGLIDEFRISRESADLGPLERKHAVTERYPASGGRFVSKPVDSGGPGSRLLRLEVSQTLPSQTDTAFFVRSGDNFYQWNESEPAWIPVRPGQSLAGVTGRFFQVAGELYPDGTGSAGPVVSSVSLVYEQNSPPIPPVRVFAAPGDGSVTLSWIASIDFDTAGYLVYYGEHPGEYLGAGSPIDAGKALSFTVSGLKNGKLYYFGIAAYDASGVRYPGTLSAEVYARPLAVRSRTAGGATGY